MNNPEFITITDTGIRHAQAIDLVPSTDPILKEVMPNFVFGFNNDAIATANLLIEALQRYKGLGLSANQIGLRKRCFVAGVGDNIVAYFNPVIAAIDDTDTELKEEGCLSFPGLFIKIRRPKKIHLFYHDYEGNAHNKQFDGMTSRIIQHETDHLNGITFKDVAGKLALQIALKKQKKSKK